VRVRARATLRISANLFDLPNLCQGSTPAFCQDISVKPLLALGLGPNLGHSLFSTGQVLVRFLFSCSER
jgi:hypothetical protein